MTGNTDNDPKRGLSANIAPKPSLSNLNSRLSLVGDEF